VAAPSIVLRQLLTERMWRCSQPTVTRQQAGCCIDVLRSVRPACSTSSSRLGHESAESVAVTKLSETRIFTADDVLAFARLTGANALACQSCTQPTSLGMHGLMLCIHTALTPQVTSIRSMLTQPLLHRSGFLRLWCMACSMHPCLAPSSAFASLAPCTYRKVSIFESPCTLVIRSRRRSRCVDLPVAAVCLTLTRRLQIKSERLFLMEQRGCYSRVLLDYDRISE